MDYHDLTHALRLFKADIDALGADRKVTGRIAVAFNTLLKLAKDETSPTPIVSAIDELEIDAAKLPDLGTLRVLTGQLLAGRQ